LQARNAPKSLWTRSRWEGDEAGSPLCKRGVVHRLTSEKLFDLFGYFLLILIGLEFVETIKAYLEENEFHVEIIILVAIIAIARKVILLGSAPAGELIGIALIIIALCGGYYLIRRAGLPRSSSPDDLVPSFGGREEP